MVVIWPAQFLFPCCTPESAHRHVAVRYQGKDNGGREEQGDVVLYSAKDPVNGGLCPYSQAVIMALLEKKIPFREVKVPQRLSYTAHGERIVTAVPLTVLH